MCDTAGSSRMAFLYDNHVGAFCLISKRRKCDVTGIIRISPLTSAVKCVLLVLLRNNPGLLSYFRAHGEIEIDMDAEISLVN